MAKVAIEDLSGTSTPVTANPYDGLITVCKDDPVRYFIFAKLMQERYQLHRTTRNGQQRSKILSNDFSGWVLDDHLIKLDGPQKDPSFVDERNCLVFWARPTQRVRNLVEVIQQKLKDAAPDIWLMPLDNLHMTAMEVTHSLNPEQIEALVTTLKPSCKTIADLPYSNRARLIKPMLSYDSAALALSYVPAAGEILTNERTILDDKYTYHHFRRDLHTAITNAGVPVGSRYVVPSAHLTIARFNSPNAFGGDPLDESIGTDIKNRETWIREIEMINKWLEAEFWPKDETGRIKPGGEWTVGEEKGLDFRHGTLWYGGGETIYLGKGF